jgi:two-component system sensor histidine kinase KdpD
MAARFERSGDGRRLDVAALIGRRPAVVVVDDLGRPNPPGADTGHRWQDVEALLDAGIDVVAGLDVRSVASLADSVEQITGERPTHAVPDRLLQDADQLELVDIAPQALRRRLAHGALYPAEQIDAARAALLRPAALAGFRASTTGG